MEKGKWIRTEEHRKKMSVAIKKIGTGKWLIGKHRSEETKRKIGVGNKGKIISKEQRLSLSISHSGKNHWNWKGGIKSIKERIYRSFKYRQWRSDVFKRDNFTCQDCGVKGGWGNKIEAHHLKSIHLIILENKISDLDKSFYCEELWDINNGQTLCEKCHKKTSSYGSNRSKLK